MCLIIMYHISETKLRRLPHDGLPSLYAEGLSRLLGVATLNPIHVGQKWAEKEDRQRFPPKCNTLNKQPQIALSQHGRRSNLLLAQTRGRYWGRSLIPLTPSSVFALRRACIRPAPSGTIRTDHKRRLRSCPTPPMPYNSFIRLDQNLGL